MRDYLEELLSLLSPGEEGEAAQWQIAEVGLVPQTERSELSGKGGAASPKPGPEARSLLWRQEQAPDLAAQAEALRLEGMAGTDVWRDMETENVLYDTAPAESAPGSLLSPEDLAGGEAPVLPNLDSARRSPALLRQGQDLERSAARAWLLAARSGLQSSAAGSAALGKETSGRLSLPGGTQAGSGWRELRTGWPEGEDPALLVDRAFQRDSRRYDRGFSLY